MMGMDFAIQGGSRPRHGRSLLAQPRDRAAVSLNSYRVRVSGPEVSKGGIFQVCCLSARRPCNEPKDCLRQATGSDTAMARAGAYPMF